MRGATGNRARRTAWFCHFNPRTPCGVRQIIVGDAIQAGGISIHAPLAGCDQCTACTASAETNFNPRTPCGVRHGVAPGFHRGVAISIHAPLAGCDAGGCGGRPPDRHFNPRTPCGVRPDFVEAAVSECKNFNPRTPCGVRLCRRGDFLCLLNFNPRTPCGVRLGTRITGFVQSRFQSTHPLRGATRKDAGSAL